MVRNFPDYEASHITPQLTLLKKFNEVLKFLKSYGIILYKHTLTTEPSSGSGVGPTITVYSTSKESMARTSDNSMIGDDIYFIQKPFGPYFIYEQYAGYYYFNIQLVFISGGSASILSYIINFDEVEEI